MAAKTNRQYAIELGKEEAENVFSYHPKNSDESYIRRLVESSIKFYIKQASSGSAMCKRKFRFTEEDEQAAIAAANKILDEKFLTT